MTTKLDHPFLLGFASGVALLPISACRRVSPRWLRWLLFATGGLVIARYAAMAHLLPPQLAGALLALSPLGFALPTVFAVDRLIQHPALSPAKLLRWSALPVAAYGVVALLAELGGPWPRLATVLRAAFVIGLIWLCAALARKLADRRLRSSLAALALSYGSLAATGPLGFLPELFILLALWAAYETAS